MITKCLNCKKNLVINEVDGKGHCGCKVSRIDMDDLYKDISLLSAVVKKAGNGMKRDNILSNIVALQTFKSLDLLFDSALKQLDFAFANGLK